MIKSMPIYAKDHFEQLRNAWAMNLPRVMAARQKGRVADPYFLDWNRIFTPIETQTWWAIRCERIPMFPQLPVLNFFIDFADPLYHVGIECDGKDWHDQGRDRTRDNKLRDYGWTIYRVTGSECVRMSDYPDLVGSYDPDSINETRRLKAAYRKYVFNTIDGVVSAIARNYYGLDSYVGAEEAAETLALHRLV